MQRGGMGVAMGPAWYPTPRISPAPPTLGLVPLSGDRPCVPFPTPLSQPVLSPGARSEPAFLEGEGPMPHSLAPVPASPADCLSPCRTAGCAPTVGRGQQRSTPDATGMRTTRCVKGASGTGARQEAPMPPGAARAARSESQTGPPGTCVGVPAGGAGGSGPGRARERSLSRYKLLSPVLRVLGEGPWAPPGGCSGVPGVF